MPDTAQPLPAPSESARTRVDGRRIVRASLLITLAYALFKVLGLAQMMVVNAYCDTATVNLFDFGYTHVLMLFFLIGEEAISPALLPLFIRRRDDDGPEPAWRLANSVITAQALLIGAAAVLVALFPEFVVHHITGWKHAADPVYRELAPRYARAMAGAMVLISLSSSTYMLLAGYKRFFVAAFGDAMLKIGLIVSVLAGVALGAEQVATAGADGVEIVRWRLAGTAALYTFGAGAFVGGVLKVGTHWVGLGHERRRLRPAFDWRSADFKKFLWLLLPLLAGILFAKFRDIVNNLYLMSSIHYDVDGITGGALQKANQNGTRLFRSLAQVVPMAVSVAMLPFLCEMVDRDRKEQLGRTVTASVRLMLLLFVPMAALMLPLSRPLVEVLLFRGQFSGTDVELTALSNATYALVLPFVAIEPILMNVYFSQRRMVMISVLGIVFSAMTVVTNWLGIRVFGVEGPAVLVLLGLSFTGWRMVKVVTFACVMRRRVPCFPARATLSFLARLAVIAAAAACAAWGTRLGLDMALRPVAAVQDWLASGGGFRATAVRATAFLIIPGAAGVAVTAAGAWVALRGDVNVLLDWGRERLRRRRGRAAPAGDKPE